MGSENEEESAYDLDLPKREVVQMQLLLDNFKSDTSNLAVLSLFEKEMKGFIRRSRKKLANAKV